MVELTDITYNVWTFMSMLTIHEALVDDCLEVYAFLYEEHSEAIQWLINNEWIEVDFFSDYSQTMYVKSTIQGLWYMHLARRDKFLEHLWTPYED